MKNTYYLMRHGFSLSNEQGIIACDDSSITQYGLTQTGKDQAASAAQTFKQIVKTAPLIISSDYLRAHQTAQILADAFDTRVILDRRLRERDFGQLNGTDFANYKKVWNVSDDDPDATPFDAESTRAVVSRVQAVIGEAESKYTDQTIVLVSHGDPLIAINSYYINDGFGAEMHYMGNAEIRPLKNPTPSVTIDT